MYRVILTGRSALRTVERRSWAGSDYKISVRDDVSQLESRSAHRGLIYDALIDLDDPFQSIRRGTEVTRRIADELALVHGCWMYEPRPRFAIDWNESQPDRDFVQVFHRLPLLHDPRHAFELDWYKEVFLRLDGLGVKGKKRGRRVRRAMHYLRESLLEDDPVDRFEDICAALEALEPELKAVYDVEGKVTAKCSSCSGSLICSECEETATRTEPWSGANRLIEEVPEVTRRDAVTLRRKRNAVVHSFKSREEILDGLWQVERVARTLVQHGVLKLLDIPVDIRGKAVSEVLRSARPPAAVVRCTIRSLSVKEVQAAANFPQLKLRGIETVIQNQPTFQHEAKPLAAKLMVWMTNHEGPWEPSTVLWWTDRIEEEVPQDIQLLVGQMPPP